MGRLQHPNPPKRMGAPRTANIKDSAGDADPARASLTAVRNVGATFGKLCDCLELIYGCGRLAFVVRLFVAGFVLLSGCRLAAMTIKIVHRFGATGLGPRVVVGDGVGYLGRKGVGPQQLHEKHQDFGYRLIPRAQHGCHGGRRCVDVSFDVHDCFRGKRGGDAVLEKTSVGPSVVAAGNKEI